MHRLSLFFLLLYFAALPHGRALADTPNTKRLVEVPISDAPVMLKRALVIGVDDYTIAHPLHVCGQDARDFAALLKTKFGFQNITLMTDAPQTTRQFLPTATNIRHQMRLLLDGVVPEKTELVVFYSGHGTRTHDAASGDADWLVPEDGDPGDISHSCFNYTDFKTQLDTARPARALLVMDACRDLMGGKGTTSSGFGGTRVDLGPQVAELQSCQPTQTSNEGNPEDFSQSVFTHFLIKGLSGDPDATADNAHTTVTFDSLKVYVQSQVSAYASAKCNGAQLPAGQATLGGMVLARTAAAVKRALTAAEQQAANDRLRTLWVNDKGTLVATLNSVALGNIRAALDAGADVNAIDKDGDTVLIDAAAVGNADIVKALLDAGAEKETKDKNGFTALLWAAQYGMAESVKVLLAAGADMNAKNNSGDTALSFAAYYGTPEIVKELLDAHAEVNAKNNRNVTALKAAEHPDKSVTADAQAATIAVLKAAGATE